MKLTKWNPDDICSQDEILTMVQSVFRELQDSEDGSWSFLVGGDTLVVGAKGIGDEIDVYECQIRNSNVDPESFPLALESIFDAKGGRVS